MGITRNEFLGNLFSYCEGTLELRAIPSKKQSFIAVDDYSAVESFFQHNKTENIYFGVATRNGHRGTKDNIREIPAVWVDIDFKSTPVEDARLNLQKFPSKPTLVVMSGGGWHCYWKFKEPSPKTDIQTVERVNKALALALGGDQNACDASRILRVPDTLNPKYTPARKVNCIRVTEHEYELSDLDEFLHSYVYSYNNIYNTKIAQNEPSHKQPQTTTASHNEIRVEFKDGNRDHSLFHTANCLVKGGMCDSNIRYILQNLASCCVPPFEEKEIEAKIQSALKRNEDKNRTISKEVEDWALTTDGHFLTTDCHKDLDLTTSNHKKAANMTLLRLVEKGILEKHGEKRGCYKLADNDLDIIDPEKASGDSIPLLWPLETLTAMVEVYPKNIILVAGEQNAGKTAFMLDFARKNMEHEIHYFSSEMSDIELNKRLLQFGDPLSFWKKVVFYDRSHAFGKVIRPNAINIIDFLEVHEDFYRVGGEIRQIYERLEKGIALIALQKKSGADYGRGGEITAEKPRLYLTLSQEYPGGRCKIIKAKNWATERNPNGYSCKYKLVKGCRFIEDGPWELKKQ